MDDSRVVYVMLCCLGLRFSGLMNASEISMCVTLYEGIMRAMS